MHRRDVAVYKLQSTASAADNLQPGQEHETQHIDTAHPSYMPMRFPLIFTHGEPGWSPWLKRMNPATKRAIDHRLTMLVWAACMIMTRPDERGVTAGTALHRTDRLFQEFCLECFAIVQEERLNFFRFNQDKLRVDKYVNVQASTARHGGDVGRRVVLLSTFIGGPRHMFQKYQDAMAVVRRLRRPSLFITFTCHPEWPEIKDNLLPGQHAFDHGDLTARVFELKLQAFMEDLVHYQMLGRVVGVQNVIEWQGRGLPHTHILLTLHRDDIPRTPEDVDAIVCAEVPDKTRCLNLWHTVTRDMLHGPCGVPRPRPPPCRGTDGSHACEDHCPFPFTHTTHIDDTKATYRRRDNSTCTDLPVKYGVHMTNRWVVPHNPWLTTKYEAHINVEIVSTVQSVKYLYKYIYKGGDRSVARLADSADEIDRFLNGRKFSSCEACWRLFQFDTGRIYPPVQRLAVHLEDEQNQTFHPWDDVEELKENGPPITTLTAFFDYNRQHPPSEGGRNAGLRYHEFPEHFAWHQDTATWEPRQNNRMSVGRLAAASPAEQERFYLRLLLTHVVCPTCYEDLRMVEGRLCDTFKEAAQLQGLAVDDREWRECMLEAATHKMPRQLRDLFALMLIQPDHDRPLHPEELWDEFKSSMSEDFARKIVSDHAGTAPEAAERVAENKALLYLQRLLRDNGKTLAHFNLPRPTEEDVQAATNTMIADATLPYSPADLRRFVDANRPLLSPDQATALSTIMDAVRSPPLLPNNGRRPRFESTQPGAADAAGGPPSRVFFMHGPAGCGTTFLYNLLCAEVRAQGRIALATAY